MQTLELPETIRQAWGPEIAHDFAVWLAEQFSLVGLAPHIQISAFVARQKVNVLVSRRVSNLLLAGEPTLTRSTASAQDQSLMDDWVWRVPVDLTFPSHGHVGCVGEIEVDARYGEVRYTAEILAQMTDETDRLAQAVLPSKA
jgi:hypothetical protein